MLPGWQVSSFLSSLYYLFKDALARREDFVTISGSSLMPLKFVSHRWLDNVPVCQRALMLWDNIADYFKATENGRVNRPPKKNHMKLSSSALKIHAFLLSYTSLSALQINCSHFCKVSNKQTYATIPQ